MSDSDDMLQILGKMSLQLTEIRISSWSCGPTLYVSICFNVFRYDGRGMSQSDTSSLLDSSLLESVLLESSAGVDLSLEDDEDESLLDDD